MRRRPDGRPLVTPERNFTELGSHLPLVDHVVVGDALVRHGWTTVEDLAAAAKRAKGHRGGPAAATAIRLVRARVDSPMETKTRLLLVLAGLPGPEPGREIYDNGGRVAATVDLQYRAQQIVIEYDGDLHRTERTKWRNDVRKRERLRDLGWIVLVVTADDLAIRPWDVLCRVQKALIARGHPDVPPTLSKLWRTHFPRRHRSRLEAAEPWVAEGSAYPPEPIPAELRWLD